MVAISLLQALLIPCLLLGLRDDRLWIVYVVAFPHAATPPSLH